MSRLPRFMAMARRARRILRYAQAGVLASKFRDWNHWRSERCKLQRRTVARPASVSSPGAHVVDQPHADTVNQWFGYGDVSLAHPVPLLETGRPAPNPARIIAFYLPQFHTIAENDAWWGRGFTEWTNVTRARPQFVGHHQPHLPGELGFYDLTNPAVMKRQIELAELYGVGGFCFYFYWFGGKRILERPLLDFLNDPDRNFPFCLCWANENWTRRWDGLDSDILIGQSHSAADDIQFIAYISKYIADPRYIRLDGKPVVIVYRPDLLPNMWETAARWRTWCRQNGIGEIALGFTQSFAAGDPAEYGLDFAIEFPPRSARARLYPNAVGLLNASFAGTVFDYDAYVEQSERYEPVTYRLFRSVMPSWDNEARKPGRSHIQMGSEPHKYLKWLRNAVADVGARERDPANRFVFVNAWNEWAEGAHLEPDRKYGYAWLEATRMALTYTAVAPVLNGSTEASSAAVAIVLHIQELDHFEQITEGIKHATRRLKLFVSGRAEQRDALKRRLDELGVPFQIFTEADRGRDIAPFLRVLSHIDADQFPFILRLHVPAHPLGGDDAKALAERTSMLATARQIDLIVGAMCAQSTIGLVLADARPLAHDPHAQPSARLIAHLACRLGVQNFNADPHDTIGDPMFFARTSSLQPLLGLALPRRALARDEGHDDGALEGALRHAIALSVVEAGYRIVFAGVASTAGEFRLNATRGEPSGSRDR